MIYRVYQKVQIAHMLMILKHDCQYLCDMCSRGQGNCRIYSIGRADIHSHRSDTLIYPRTTQGNVEVYLKGETRVTRKLNPQGYRIRLKLANNNKLCTCIFEIAVHSSSLDDSMSVSILRSIRSSPFG